MSTNARLPSVIDYLIDLLTDWLIGLSKDRLTGSFTDGLCMTAAKASRKTNSDFLFFLNVFYFICFGLTPHQDFKDFNCDFILVLWFICLQCASETDRMTRVEVEHEYKYVSMTSVSYSVTQLSCCCWRSICTFGQEMLNTLDSLSTRRECLFFHINKTDEALNIMDTPS